jgi:proline iminopeptidase
MSMKVRVRALTAVLLCTACSASHPGPGVVREREAPRAATGYVGGAGGTRLFYRVDGGGPDTIVVLHGGPGFNLEGIRPDLTPLARHHALIYFDQRGGGRSEMPDALQLTAGAMIEDVEALRRAYRLDRLTLLGHSWGGGLAVLYAAHYPGRVRRLILVSPIPPRWKPYMDQSIATQALRHDSAESARLALLDSMQAIAPDPQQVCREMARIMVRGFTATPEAARRVRGDVCAGTPENIRAMAVVNGRIWQSLVNGPPPEGDYDWRPLAARVSAPTLVVHGEADPFPLAGSEEWVQALPAARLVVVPGAGHFPHAERPELFFPPVEEFLAEGPAVTPAEITLLRSRCETDVISLIKDIALIVLGFLLGLVPGWFERRRRIRGHWGALAAEAEMCERLAGAYLADNVPAPLYRLPEAAFSASFPALLAEGVIVRLEARQLTEFRGAIQEINRGLDIASEARAANNNTLLQTEAGRLNTKCRNLLEGRGSTLPPSPFIRQMLERHAGVAGGTPASWASKASSSSLSRSGQAE